MNERDRQICRKILTEIAVLHELMSDIAMEEFLRDERTARAVSMTLINIGELVKNITPGLKEAHREIPWRAIAGMRDIAAHKYQTLRKEDVFTTCAEDIPELEGQLRRLTRETESDDGSGLPNRPQ